MREKMNSDLDFGKRSVRIRVVEKWIIKIKDDFCSFYVCTVCTIGTIGTIGMLPSSVYKVFYTKVNIFTIQNPLCINNYPVIVVPSMWYNNNIFFFVSPFINVYFINIFTIQNPLDLLLTTDRRPNCVVQ